jgi:secondary thiamine-phosphate synthase enzyme
MDFMAQSRRKRWRELLRRLTRCISVTEAKKTETKPGALTRTIEVKTERRTQLKNITGEIEKAVAASGCKSGLCYVYVPHTTAGVIVNEGDDPDVARDIEAALDRMIPHEANYRHAEGNADSHIKTALTATTATIFIEDGALALGRWQAIFFCEFDGPRRREVRVRIVADASGPND